MSTNPTSAGGRNTMTKVSIAPQITGGPDFLPRYEETLNRNLQAFEDPQGHATLQPFDKIQEPVGRSGMSRRAKILIIAGSLICFAILVAAITTGALYVTSEHYHQAVSAPTSSTEGAISTVTTFVITETTLQASISTRSDSVQTVTATVTVVQTTSATQPQPITETESGILFVGSSGPGSAPVSTEAYTSFVTILQPATSSTPSTSRSEIIISPIATTPLTAQTVWTEIGTWVTGSSTWTETNLATFLQPSSESKPTPSISSKPPTPTSPSPSTTVAFLTPISMASSTPPPPTPRSTVSSHFTWINYCGLAGQACDGR